jgi:ferredoxin
LQADVLTAHLQLPGYRREIGYERIRRFDPPASEVGERLGNAAAQVELVYDEKSARREASRCLDCGVTPVFDGSRCVLCGGCVDVCPTQCLKLVRLADLDGDEALDEVIDAGLGSGADRAENTAILKDEDRCIRCALCVMRCPADAIVMERVQFTTTWRAS